MKNQFPILLIALTFCFVQIISNNQAAAARGGGHGGGHGGGGHSHGSGGHSRGGGSSHGGIIHGGYHGHLHFYRTWYSGGRWCNGYFDESGNQLNEAEMERLYNAERPAVTSTPYANGATEATVVRNYAHGDGVETSSITIKTGNR